MPRQGAAPPKPGALHAACQRREPGEAWRKMSAVGANPKAGRSRRLRAPPAAALASPTTCAGATATSVHHHHHHHDATCVALSIETS
eukprot:scaffold1919_cov394-Prasinococcus_capsulatus_cf.AAC.8